MTKLIEIRNCGICPHSTFGFGGLRCKLHDCWIDVRYRPKIPDWCTLDDAKIIFIEPLTLMEFREDYKDK